MDVSIPLSIIVVWRDVREGLADGLRTLVGQVEAAGGEVIVVSAMSSSLIEPIRAEFPRVVWVAVDPPATEPIAWERGAQAARGATLAFGHARCRYAPGWTASLLLARARGARIVAGPVLLDPSGPQRLAARSAYLCDYAMFADPDSPTGRGAAASNVAFAREALPAIQPGRGLHKSQILAQGGGPVAWARGMAVATGPFRPAWRDWLIRFHRARHYADWRSASWPRPIRVSAGLACVFLPVVLFGRLAWPGRSRLRHVRTLALGSPWIAASLVSWSIGEMAGYWTGAGASARFL